MVTQLEGVLQEHYDGYTHGIIWLHNWKGYYRVNMMVTHMELYGYTLGVGWLYTWDWMVYYTQY